MEESGFVTFVVEGQLDQIVARKLISATSINNYYFIVKRGKKQILERLYKFNNTCKSMRQPWIVLMDLDNDAECAPVYLEEKLPAPAADMFLRLAVQEVESWLLADRQGIAKFLGVSEEHVPKEVEKIQKPKRTLIDIARKSRRRDIKGMVPQPGSSGVQGKEYNSIMSEFVLSYWKPDSASENADSLLRFLKVLERIEKNEHIRKE
ncbi:MAG: hypothetical protein R6V10_10485 [bacterium]